ncbi:MAG: DUF6383 domain-containing protein [Parabacteroides sp.]|nr:DUF6383 domain-containing protein [Parabacteroides sp.]
MNKKFSKLVASLLFASAFSAFAGTTTSMSAAPTVVVSTRAIVTGVETALDSLSGWDQTVGVEGQLLSTFADDSRLYIIENAEIGAEEVATDNFLSYSDSEFVGAEYEYENASSFYWSVTTDGQIKNQDNRTLSVDGYSDFEIVPVSNSSGIDVGTFFALALKTSDEDKVVYVELSDGKLILSEDSATEYSTNITTAALFSPIKTAFTNAATGGDLNGEQEEGFSVTVTYDGDKSLIGAELFARKMTAVKVESSFPLAGEDDESYALEIDGEYLFFDEEANSSNTVKGGFKLISGTEADSLIPDATKATKDSYLTFVIKAADNGTEAVEITVADGRRLYVNVSNGTNVLTALNPDSLGSNAANWADATLVTLVSDETDPNTVDFKTLLTGKFVKVNYVETGYEDATNRYKIDGVLGLRYNTTNATVEGDFVKAADFVEEDPSTMWAPSIVGDSLVLTNRENKNVKVTLSSLRIDEDAYEATIVESDSTEYKNKITITPVASVAKTDGYKVYADNVLINSAFYLGQSRRNADGDVPAYWAENHGTHQIGATVDQTEATIWNVQLVKKGTSLSIDSVLVVSKLYNYSTETDITEITDTLAVLPYVFQNRDNREYVKLNDEINLEYYICDENNNQAEDNGSAQIFALKKRPDDTYNYVTLGRVSTAPDENVAPVDAINGEFKVYLKNSANKGAWENIETYSDDANSLMIVESIDAPKYRKVVAAWGDTIRIYRQEYSTEALFEKHDANSVVDGETLSFLNVNNSVSGANTALFVDTAYVNRTVNSVENTCYQYLLAANLDKEDSVVCPYTPEHNTQAWRDEHGGPCADAIAVSSLVEGRFLINLIDTAYAYKQDHLHDNPYINMTEADENLAKLSFVEGIHTNDTLYITRKGGEVVKLGMTDPAFNVAKFAFRYVDNEEGSFRIQTQYKNYDATDQEEFDSSADNEGYLRWVNGTIVVTNRYTNGEVFNMEENYAGNPTANDAIKGAATISVATTDGAVVVKGAEGRTVVISNVLGQTVASTIITSSEAKISVPAGIVFVAVEGEAAVKAIVK